MIAVVATILDMEVVTTATTQGEIKINNLLRIMVAMTRATLAKGGEEVVHAPQLLAIKNSFRVPSTLPSRWIYQT